jgi:hypothetical protein
MDEDERPADEDAAFWQEARLALADRLGDLAEEMNIHDADLGVLLMEAVIDTRRLLYVQSVAKPSGSGLRTELDRLLRDFGDLIREARRSAGEVVAELTTMLAEEAAEEEAAEEAAAGDAEGRAPGGEAANAEGPGPGGEDWGGPDYDRPGRMR